jgi:exopolysaccharide biosynthesis polyprenyl glycosylphosphotransferase
MYSANHQTSTWRVFLRLSDLLSIALSFPLAYWTTYYWDAVPTPIIDRLTWINCLFVGCIDLYLMGLFGLYRWQPFIKRGLMLRLLALSVFTGSLIFMALRLFLLPTDHITMSFGYLPALLVNAGYIFLLVSCFRLGVFFLETHYFKSSRIERLAFVSWSDRMEQVLQGSMHNALSSTTVVGYFTNSEYPSLRPPDTGGFSDLGSLQDLRAQLEKHKITMLIVDLSNLGEMPLLAITEICADLMVGLELIPWTFDVWSRRLVMRVVNGVPIMVIKEPPLERFSNIILKRLIDIFGALVGIVISAPLIIVLGILIKRESPGSIFYTQPRSGFRGKNFQIIKLRSMRLDANEGTGVIRAIENDPRRLKIGEFIRQWNLDEVPQFWNVLKGEMSLVGPRPEIYELIDGLRASLHCYNLRHLCKPGMTGWASVNGFRGNTSLEERINYDLFYIENWSLMFDFKILLMTFLPPKNAY